MTPSSCNRSRVAVALIPSSRATGTPRSVCPASWPARTRPSHSLRCARKSLIATSTRLSVHEEHVESVRLSARPKPPADSPASVSAKRRGERRDGDVGVEDDQHLRRFALLGSQGPLLLGGERQRLVLAERDAPGGLVGGDPVHQRSE